MLLEVFFDLLGQGHAFLFAGSHGLDINLALGLRAGGTAGQPAILKEVLEAIAGRDVSDRCDLSCHQVEMLPFQIIIAGDDFVSSDLFQGIDSQFMELLGHLLSSDQAIDIDVVDDILIVAELRFELFEVLIDGLSLAIKPLDHVCDGDIGLEAILVPHERLGDVAIGFLIAKLERGLGVLDHIASVLEAGGNPVDFELELLARHIRPEVRSDKGGDDIAVLVKGLVLLSHRHDVVDEKSTRSVSCIKVELVVASDESEAHTVRIGIIAKGDAIGGILLVELF